MELLKQLFGRLHPVIVHLPLGFLILGILLYWYDRNKKRYVNVLGLIFLWGGYAAIVACITGYLHYLSEGYAFDTIKWHLWAGLVTAGFSFLMVARLKDYKTIAFLDKMPFLGLSLVFFLVISFTGHQGGRITHGEDYLVEPLPNSLKSALGFDTFEEKNIVLTDENWESARLYADVVKPILNNRCISCHGPKKTKGNLQLHTKEGILKGGENGEVIHLENPKNSPLLKRLLLPKDHEDHMPPKEKTQPTKEEIKILETWILQGHTFDASIGDLTLEKELFAAYFPQVQANDFPQTAIATASPDSITIIKKRGIHVERISKASNYLSVSCINTPSFNDGDFDLLLPIREQIAILDLGGTEITDAIFTNLTLLPNLTILKLDHTKVSGANISLLTALEHLKTLNLTATQFKKEHVSILADFKNLRKVSLYRTDSTISGEQLLNAGQLTIDYGNYDLPIIASDSIVY